MRRAKTIWITGLSGSGKTTTARHLAARFRSQGIPNVLLDGDSVRNSLSSDLGFTPADRRENIRRIAEMAKLVNASDIHAIVACISPLVADRNLARELIGEDNYFQIYLSATLVECEERDIKGLYAKARAGLIQEFTGISSPYEVPCDSALAVDSFRIGLANTIHLIEAKTQGTDSVVQEST